MFSVDNQDKMISSSCRCSALANCICFIDLKTSMYINYILEHSAFSVSLCRFHWVPQVYSSQQNRVSDWLAFVVINNDFYAILLGCIGKIINMPFVSVGKSQKHNTVT